MITIVRFLLKIFKFSNSIMFQFKQFKVLQDKTAMKVSTDACILGAYADVSRSECEHILDIGTGTGLLALMLAQRNLLTNIDAVEIDESAYNQSVENIADSIFKDRINLFHATIQAFKTDKLYDLIISNPPFYSNHLQSEKIQKNLAHHTNSLSFEELIEAVTKFLKPCGTFVVLLPEYETTRLVNLANQSLLFPQKQLVIRHRQNSKILRIITTFGYSEKIPTLQELIIKNPDETYTKEFRELLKEFYLIF
jgi:tRNA1Val (adenine37-N6)-methyltransferase